MNFLVSQFTCDSHDDCRYEIVLHIAFVAMAVKRLDIINSDNVGWPT